MKHSLIILSLCWLFTSCATLLNGPLTCINVETTQPATIICNSDSIKTDDKNYAHLSVKRSAEPLTLTTLSDSLEGRIIVYPRNSFAYLYNFSTLGIGAIIERKDPRRYEYPWHVKIDPSDTTTRVYDNMNTPRKGSLYLNMTYPYINNFYFNPENQGSRSSTGFLGSAAGLDYYYGSKSFLNISISGVLDFFLPFPVPIDYQGGELESFNSSYFSISDNRRIDRFSLGYGLCYAKNNWYYTVFGEDEINDVISRTVRSCNAVGFVCFSFVLPGRKNILCRSDISSDFLPVKCKGCI